VPAERSACVFFDLDRGRRIKGLAALEIACQSSEKFVANIDGGVTDFLTGCGFRSRKIRRSDTLGRMSVSPWFIDDEMEISAPQLSLRSDQETENPGISCRLARRGRVAMRHGRV
jgi:hypothetical protein